MNNQGILLTIFAGSFFLVGYVITLLVKKRTTLNEISMGMSLSVLILLAVLELNTEAMEKINNYFNNNFISILVIVGSIIIGMLILKLLEKFVPHHDHYSEKLTHDNHLYHIGLMTGLSLIIHNIIEGMSIYSLGVNSLSNGLILALGIGLHNLPFGVQISTMMEGRKNSNIKVLILMFCLVLSTFIGGLLISLFNNLNELFIGILIGITLGMVVYIVIFELLTEIKESKNKKNVNFGIIIGCVVMAISLLL